MARPLGAVLRARTVAILVAVASMLAGAQAPCRFVMGFAASLGRLAAEAAGSERPPH